MKERGFAEGIAANLGVNILVSYLHSLEAYFMLFFISNN